MRKILRDVCVDWILLQNIILYFCQGMTIRRFNWVLLCFQGYVQTGLYIYMIRDLADDSWLESTEYLFLCGCNNLFCEKYVVNDYKTFNCIYIYGEFLLLHSGRMWRLCTLYGHCCRRLQSILYNNKRTNPLQSTDLSVISIKWLQLKCTKFCFLLTALQIFY